MVKAKVFVLHKQFAGLPKQTDLKLIEEELPPLKDGEFLSEAIYLSVDPYMRAYAPRIPLGNTYIGSQIAKVLESKNPKFPVGSYVVGEFGWRTRTVSDGSPIMDLTKPDNFPEAWVIPDPQGLPISLSLGVLGMPGMTAYFGFLEICQSKAGDTVVVSGAAGAVGSIVGQIAKIKGCKVIGITGSNDKGEWLVEELKFDHFVNYKDQDFLKKLAVAAPNGVDCYFDNVGGQLSNQVLSLMNVFGRVAVCGSSSAYNDPETAKAAPVQFYLVVQQLRMEGFVVHRWTKQWPEGIRQCIEWIKQGKLKYRETLTEGFENMPKAFIKMLQGDNVGKAIIKV